MALVVDGLIDAAMWGTKLAFLPWMLLAYAACAYAPVTAPRRVHRPAGDAHPGLETIAPVEMAIGQLGEVGVSRR